MSISKSSQVFKLYSDAVRVSTDDDVTFQAWDKDGKEITLDHSAINTEFAKVDYKNKRSVDYDSIKEQLDQLYWDKKNGTNKWVEAIDKVKSDNPKP